MVDAIETQGTTFEIGSGSSPIAYTLIKGVTSFQGLDGSASEIDVTTLDSEAKEFLMGLQDWGNWKLDVNALPEDPGQVALREAKGSRLIKPIRVTLKDGTILTFNGYVTQAPLSGGVDAKLEGSYNIRISGDVTFA